jgi:signal transduction histidine kinase
MFFCIKVKYIVTISLAVFILGFSTQLAASDTIEFNNEEELLDISSSLLIYEDQSATLSLNEVILKKFNRTKSLVPNFGISKSIFWIKIPIKNNSKTQELLLNLSSPTIDKVEFYYPNIKNEYHSIKMGEELVFNNRKYKDPSYLFDVIIPIGETNIYYLKISSKDGIQLPIKIGTKNAIYNYIKNRDLLSGIYLGIMLVMILYNLFVYFSVKDISYLVYVFYILLVLLAQTLLQGYPFQYLWGDYPQFAQYSIFIFPSLVGIAGMIFMIIFLKVESYSKRLYKLSFLLSSIYLIPIILPFFNYHKFSYQVMEINAGIVSVYILTTSIIILKKGYEPAKYFLAAWIVFLTGVIIFILKDVDILPFNNFTRYTMQIGSAVETVLLSFALAARINIYKKEKEESQQKTVEVLKENAKIIKEQNIILEQKVTKRTEELNKTLNHLKETQSQLVDAEKMSSLGQLTAGIAHEINNPINFVSSNIAPLRQDIEDVNTIINKYEELEDSDNIKEKLKEIEELKKELDFDYLKTELSTIIDGIEDGAKRTTEIVSGLRNFSRLDEGELKKVNINEGVESTLILIKNKLNGIKIDKSLGNIPSIDCNPGKLNQMTMNLIDNAIYAINKKDIENQNGLINVITECNDNSIILTIRDNGIGIPEAIKDNLFEPFFTTKDVGDGTGLGLSIVRSIVDSHNGKIIVNSEVNKGTEIIVEIPIKRESDGKN